MAIPHFQATFIGRTRSAVASAAYRHRSPMLDMSTGQRWSYRGDDVVHAQTSVPDGAPAWAQRLVAMPRAEAAQLLWNVATAAERQVNGQPARELMIALPIELSRGENIALMQEYVAQELCTRGLVCDWVFHDKPGNPHVHLMHTLRPLTATGFGIKKVALRGDDGSIVRAPSGKIVYRDFVGDRSTLIDLRTAWAATATRHLAAAGHDLRLDLASYRSRGIGLLPSQHVGPAGKAIGVDGRTSRAGDAAIEHRETTAVQLAHNPGLIIDLVADGQSVFDRRDIAKALHRFIDDPRVYTDVLTRALADPRLVTLAPGDEHHPSGLPRAARLATSDMIAVEARMVETAVGLATGSRHAIAPEVVAAAVASASRTLSADQLSALDHVTLERDFATVVGFAGAGKSTMLAVANEAWSASGKRVCGASLSGKAVQGLEQSSGIPSRTIASWIAGWDRGRALPVGAVFVVDEAGMVSSKLMARIVSEVSSAQGKLVLIGDTKQLQPIQAGGAFRALTDHVCPDRLATAAAIVDRYMVLTGSVRDDGGDSAATSGVLVLAYLRDDVLALNTAIAERRLGLGLTHAPMTVETANGARTMAICDRLQFLKGVDVPIHGRNIGSVRVANGQFGTIVDTSFGGLTIALDGGPTVTVDCTKVPEVDLAYATTIHKAQGATVDHTLIMGNARLDAYLGLVALSRHRETATLFVPQTEIADRSRLLAILSRAEIKTTTLDYAERRDIAPTPKLPFDLTPLMVAASAVLERARAALDRLWQRVCEHVNAKNVSQNLRYQMQPDRNDAMTTTFVKTVTTPAGLSAQWGRDATANALAKEAGAKWSNDTKSWIFDPNRPDTSKALDAIETRMHALDTSRSLAAGIVFATPLVDVQVAHGKLAVLTPKDAVANALLKEIGASWSKDDAAFIVEIKDAAHVERITALLAKVDAHLVASAPDRAAIEAVNAQFPGLKASIGLVEGVPRLQLQPPYDREIIHTLKDAPLSAVFSAANKTWTTQIAPTAIGKEIVSASLTRIAERVAILDEAKVLAPGLTSEHPLITLSARGPNLVVSLPKDNNAASALIAAGFAWQAKISAYSTVVDSPAKSERLMLGLSEAGRQLDRALIPHTPEHTGIPALTRVGTPIILGDRQAAVAAFAVDPNVRQVVNTLVARVEGLAPATKAALAAGDIGGLAAATGLTEEHAERAITVVAAASALLHEGLELRETIERSQAISQEQAQGFGIG